MALYWNEGKVALDIIDDPDRRPFDGGEGWTVIETTTEDLGRPDTWNELMTRISELVGTSVPTSEPMDMPVELQRGMSFYADIKEMLPDEVLTVAHSDDEAESMAGRLEREGIKVKGTSVWDGPVPDGSLVPVSYGTRIATAEFFFLRKANQLPFDEAVAVCKELVSLRQTRLTCYSMEEGEVMPLSEPQTSPLRLYAYLKQIEDTDEGRMAMAVLDSAIGWL